MENSREIARDLKLLEEVERDPNATQANLADRLDVAVGTVNWYLNRLIAKGYVKAKRLERRKLRYIITPEGIALRAKLTVAYIENSLTLYRQVRNQAQLALRQAKEHGYHSVYIDGNGDIADICKLSCLEQGLTIVDKPFNNRAAIIEIRGHKIYFSEPSGLS